MDKSNIMAIVVSFNSPNKLEKNITQLLKYVGDVCIVDNGSVNDETHKYLDSISTHDRVTVLKLKANKGIGEALNQGVYLSQEKGAQWVLTMDQDSFLDSSMIENYCNVVNSYNEDLFCLSPQICLDRCTPKNTKGIYEVDCAITSGNLVNLDVFNTIGYYDNELFIDHVDFDFSLRVRKAGFKIIRVEDAILYHELGDMEDCHIPRYINKFYIKHSPLRRYYMFRNLLYLIEGYILRFPLFIMKLSCLQFILFILIPFYDDRPLQSLKFICIGFIDFTLRKKGKYQGYLEN